MNRIRIKSEIKSHEEVAFNDYIRADDCGAKNYKTVFMVGPTRCDVDVNVAAATL